MSSGEDDPLTIDEEYGGQQTVSTTGSSDNDGSNSGSNNVRNRFVSNHRRTLNHISTDANKSLFHNVPSVNDMQAASVAGSSVVTRSENRGRALDSVKKICHESAKLETFLPCWRWLKGYDWKTTFLSDLVAGCTVGIMIVPQSMSYAELAGLPVQFGLYSSLLPVYAYALFGSSRQLAVGPVALISLLLSSGLPNVLDENDPNYEANYIQTAIQASFLVGVINILMGVLRMGFVTIFLSHAVISGFTSGAAVIIGLSQVKSIVGYDIDRSDRLHTVLGNLIKNIGGFNWKTFLMGTTCVCVLVGLKSVGRTYPRFKFAKALGPLFVVVVTILLTWSFGLQDKGIPIIESIPQGLPKLTVNEWFPVNSFGDLFVVVISIVVVGFMESIAIAKSLAAKHKYEIDSSDELIGLGMANLMGAMFQSYPVTGSFSRSAVNNESGSQSGISGLITATMVMAVLLFLTPVFEKLPHNVLASIVISGVISLVDYEEAIHLWKVHKFDFGVWVVAFLGTMFLGVKTGLAIAVGVSLLLVVYESAYPHTSVLGRLPGTRYYRNIKQYETAERYDGIVIVEIDAPLYFANAQNVRDKIRKYRMKAEPLKFLILEMSSMSHIDTSALHVLKDMYETYLERGQQICFSNPNLKVCGRLEKAGFVDLVGRQHFFTGLNDAVTYCLQTMDTEAVTLHKSTSMAKDPIADDQEDSSEDTL